MKHQHQVITVATKTAPSNDLAGIKDFLFSDVGLLSCVGVLALITLMFLQDKNPKGKLARARFANKSELRAARQLALKQIQARKLSESALYIGSPKGSYFKEINGQRTIHLPPDPKTLYIPFAGEGILYIGRPGSGKTYSAGDPLVRSAIDQGHSIFYYDFKGHESPAPSSKLLGYAQERGYKISVVAPGFPETSVCNLLDFLSSPNDAEMAYQLASVLNQNFKLDDTSGNASFFTQAGKQLIQGVLMLAKKAAPYDDIAMCHKILATPNLLERLAEASLDQYISVAFDNFLSAAGSPETAFSIAATASLMFSNFMRPETLATFCGKTTLPLDVDSRHFVVFKMNPSKRSSVGPLIAATIHLMVNRNIFRPRKKPLVFSGDEIPSLDLIMLADWLNQNRSSGFVGIIGAQALGFLEDTYGEKRVNGILSGCTTQLIFQLNDVQTAEYYSKLLGAEEVRYKQKSKSNGKGGSSYSLADHQQTRPLVEIQEFEQFPKGKCILLNPGYGHQKRRIRIPLLHQIRIPVWDVTAMDNSAAMWPKIQTELIRKSTARELSDAELKKRATIAEQMLPLPGRQADLLDSFKRI